MEEEEEEDDRKEVVVVLAMLTSELKAIAEDLSSNSGMCTKKRKYYVVTEMPRGKRCTYLFYSYS